jgi:hypothetical protein
MRWFCHISEFGGDAEGTPFAGATVLPTMLFLSDRLTLWAPSATQFREAKKRGESMLGPEDILYLVQKKHIQVIGRKDWLTSPAERERSKWRHALWDDDFDDQIAEIALADEELARPDRRVVFIDKEDGWDWADKQMESFTQAAATARELLAQRRLPPGFLQKATRQGRPVKKEDKERFEAAAKSAHIPLAQWMRIRSVLRDARNHEAGFEFAECNLSVEPSEHVEAVPSIMGPRAHQDDKDYHLPTNAQLWEFLRIAASLSRPRNVHQIEKLKERPDRDELVREMTPYMTNPNAALELKRQLKTDRPGWGSVLNPFSGRTEVQKGVKAVSYIDFANAFFELIHGQINPTSSIGLTCAMFGFGIDIAEKVNLLPVSDDSRDKFPLVLAYNRTAATHKQWEKLYQKVKA